MSRPHPDLAPYERARWVDGSYHRDPLEQHRAFVHKTGRDFTGHGPREHQDQRMHEQICQALERHGYVDASDVEVQCNAGEVTLTGTVPDRQQKRLAEQIADEVAGVKDIHNRLSIRI